MAAPTCIFAITLALLAAQTQPATKPTTRPATQPTTQSAEEKARQAAEQARLAAIERAKGQLPQLQQRLVGSFHNAEQALGDDRFPVVQLHVRPIWKSRDDGPWLYVEHLAARAPDRPYRQQVYRLHVSDKGELLADVYAIPGDTLRYANAWQQGDPLSDLEPGKLKKLDAATLHFQREESTDAFVGKTRGKGAETKVNGAVRRTTELAVGKNEITQHDRGFDKEDKPVWGETGPIRFRRMD